MPELSRFFGIVIRMFSEPGSPRNVPHFHAYYQDEVAVLAIDPVDLIFNESINNIARHSRATEAHIALRVEERQLALEVTDNGCGIERWDHHNGNGLESMKLRAARLGGELQVRSIAGHGTTLLLRAPLPV